MEDTWGDDVYGDDVLEEELAKLKENNKAVRANRVVKIKMNFFIAPSFSYVVNHILRISQLEIESSGLLKNKTLRFRVMMIDIKGLQRKP